VEWFNSKNAELVQVYGRAIPSIAFVHIPINAMAAFQRGGVDAQEEPGINDDNPLAQQGIQNIRNADGNFVPVYTGKDIPFMSALLATEGLIALFSGHDHGDDW
jgi:hypothetical protein